MRDVDVTTADGVRYVADWSQLRLPGDMRPVEEVRAAGAVLLNSTGTAAVPADLLGSWLEWAAAQQGGCCMFHSPCSEHEKALAVARHVLSRESR